MSRSILVCVLGFIIFSCRSDDDNGTAEVWRLTAIYSHQLDTLEEGPDLSFQETLYFSPYGTFIKRRLAGAERFEARGRYSKEVLDGRQAYRVEYDQNGLLVFNCFGQPIEYFILESPGLVQRDGIPCDGPEYRYVRDGLIQE